MDYKKLTITSANAARRQGQLSLQELTDFHIRQIEQFNPKVRALRVFDKEKVLAECVHNLEQLKRGAVPGRLNGLLFSAKDSVPVKGYPTSHGTKSSEKPATEHSSFLVQRLLDEGAICVGKSNMAEQGKSYYTDNPLFGKTHNPYNLEHSPGGSGGGDSAAVASDFAMFGIGADAGGSIRVPASFCGLFGLFPTRGVFSDAGIGHIVHTFSRLFRGAGVIARSLPDLELLFKILRVCDPDDPFSVPFPQQTLTKQPAKKIACFHEINGVKCDPEISAALKSAAARFEAAGFTLSEHTPPACAGAYEIFILLAGQASLILDDMLASEAGKPVPAADEGAIMSNLRTRIKNELPPPSYELLLKALYLVDLLRNQILQTFAEFDFILCPVSATLPPKHNTSLYRVGGQDLQSQQVFQFASMVNVLALPAIAFPTNLSKQGLPVGLQLIGPRFSEPAMFDTLRNAGFTKKPDSPTL